MLSSQLVIALVFLVALIAPTVYARKAAHIEMVQTPKRVDLDLCPTCVDFISDTLNQLLEIILNGGVIGSCAKLCGLLNNSIEEDACNLLCDIVGVNAFIKIIQSIDPDPIFICEQLHACPSSTTGNVTINSVEVNPPSGPLGTVFKLLIEYTIWSNIGTGQWAVEINPIGLGTATNLFSPANGTYSIGATIPTKPTQQNQWAPGPYEVVFAVCEGTCGSKHSGAAIVAEAYGNFTITQ